MPGSGKSTIGKHLADLLGYAFMDTDMLLEALYGRRLQDITNILGTEEFRDIECKMICMIQAKDCVIATGGSAIYRQAAIAHLKELGPLVLLNPSYETISKRVAMMPERGISFGPGQTLRDIYMERQPLYLEKADLECDSGEMSAGDCARWIARKLPIPEREGSISAWESGA